MKKCPQDTSTIVNDSDKITPEFIREKGITSSYILLNPNLVRPEEAAQVILENKQKKTDAIMKEMEEIREKYGDDAANAYFSGMILFVLF